MKIRTAIVLLLALTCGGSAVVVVNHLRQKSQPAQDQYMSIVVAAKHVPRGGLISAESLKTVEWPKQRLPVGALTSAADAVGRYVLVPLVPEEPVLESKLAETSFGAGLASMIPNGMRAFTIEASHLATGVGGFVLPGSKVDVLLTTISHGVIDETGGGATTTLLQNVTVLAVDQWLNAPEENKVDPKELKSVTLLVTLDQAAKLDLGMSRGTLHLALRNPSDDREADTRPATMAELRFHQERPLPDLVTPGEPAGESKPVRVPRVAEIRTSRGSHQGVVRIELN